MPKAKEPQIFYDAKGKKTHVLLPIKVYQMLLEALEDAEDVRAIQEVEHEADIPFEDVKRLLSKKRR